MIGNQNLQPVKPANSQTTNSQHSQPIDDKMPAATKQVAKDEGERFLKAIFRTMSDEIASHSQEYDARLAKIEELITGMPSQFQKLQADILRMTDEKMQALKNEQQKLLQSNIGSLRSEVVSAIDAKNEQLKQDVSASFEQFESTMQANLEAVGALEVKLHSAKIVFPEDDKAKQKK